jgi:hypothetical protein
VPVFSFDKLAECKKAKYKNKEHSAEIEKVFKTYLLSYTAFLNHHYSVEFQHIITNFYQKKSFISLSSLTKKSSKDSKKYS